MIGTDLLPSTMSGRQNQRCVREVFFNSIIGLQVEPAKATDEIQVYNAGIAAVGQFTIQQHLNYIPLGVKDPPFPGGLISNNSISGTPEFAYGLTDWWELFTAYRCRALP
jgi:hypothetical protein